MDYPSYKLLHYTILNENLHNNINSTFFSCSRTRNISEDEFYSLMKSTLDCKFNKDSIDTKMAINFIRCSNTISCYDLDTANQTYKLWIKKEIAILQFITSNYNGQFTSGMGVFFSDLDIISGGSVLREKDMIYINDVKPIRPIP